MKRAIVRLALCLHLYRQAGACGCGSPCNCACGCGWLPPPTSSSHYLAWAEHVLDAAELLTQESRSKQRKD